MDAVRVLHDAALAGLAEDFVEPHRRYRSRGNDVAQQCAGAHRWQLVGVAHDHEPCGVGQRRYQRSVLRRLAFIRAASNVGLTLEEIRRELGSLPANRTPTSSMSP